MPPVRSSRTRKAPPAGFADLEDTLLTFAAKLKDAQTSSTSTQQQGSALKKHESLWPIHQISHQRSRYIYDLFYTKSAISRPLYDYLLKNGYADAALIAKWKKEGYEKLCCVRCIQTKETNFGSTCICRVPKAQLERGERDKDGGDAEGGGDGDGEDGKGKGKSSVGKVMQCVNCGCRGCASSD